MKIKIWKKTKNRIVYAVQYANSLKSLKVVFLTYYGPCYGIDKFTNYYPKDINPWDYENKIIKKQLELFHDALLQRWQYLHRRYMRK